VFCPYLKTSLAGGRTGRQAVSKQASISALALVNLFMHIYVNDR
jgi:hypothetical protein